MQSAICGGSGIITGSFTTQQAQDLALLLRAGALPAPLKIIEERSVGPELGADSIQAGVYSCIVGFLLVVVYMVAAYGLFGLFANAGELTLFRYRPYPGHQNPGGQSTAFSKPSATLGNVVRSGLVARLDPRATVTPLGYLQRAVQVPGAPNGLVGFRCARSVRPLVEHVPSPDLTGASP